MAYEYVDGDWVLGFEACLCPDIDKLHEMVENETKEKGKLKNHSLFIGINKVAMVKYALLPMSFSQKKIIKLHYVIIYYV